MRGSMIKAIIFDLDDTLFDFKRAHVEGMKAWAAYAEQQFHISPDETISEVSALVKEQAEKIGPLAASHNRVLRAELWLEKHGLPLFPHATALAERYWEALIAAAEPTEGAAEVLRDLQMRGFLIGVGTNMTAYVQYKKIEKLGLGSYIDFIVTSEVCGVDKPIRHFFKYCLKKANEVLERQGRRERIEINEILFIGDSLKHDVEGARNAKMHALLLDPAGRHPEEEERIQSFREISEVLERLG